jgi:hypothetical protein
MSDFYDATNEVDYFKALQRRINDGSIWSLEGSAGRAAHEAIVNGCCVLGRRGHRDYWGNYVPARHEVKEGTKGSCSYARRLQPEIAAKTIRVRG